ncbi:hypothetical protein GOP47_0014087 [Adiantum capillus-veneris]|uniref:Uncharacterized protein n=1 Tax=Adiantum capillus-veneris TaxID=13818 RepID=A0A9D4UQG6_ADICA|nr:hypothetical protein GOP47_0014087 [Adiantum capillus-veneris]
MCDCLLIVATQAYVNPHSCESGYKNTKLCPSLQNLSKVRVNTRSLSKWEYIDHYTIREKTTYMHKPWRESGKNLAKFPLKTEQNSKISPKTHENRQSVSH